MKADASGMDIEVVSVTALGNSGARKALVRGVFTLECFVDASTNKCQAPRTGKFPLVSEGNLIDEVPAVEGRYNIGRPTVKPVV